MELSATLNNEAATVALGRCFAKAAARQGLCVYLIGDLGAGKPPFVAVLFMLMGIEAQSKVRLIRWLSPMS